MTQFYTHRAPKNKKDAIENLKWTDDIYDLFMETGEAALLPDYIDRLGRCREARDVAMNVVLDMFVKCMDCGYWEKIVKVKFLEKLVPFVPALQNDSQPAKNIQKQLQNVTEKQKAELIRRRREYQTNRVPTHPDQRDTYHGSDLSQLIETTSARAVYVAPTTSDMAYIVHTLATTQLETPSTGYKLPNDFEICQKIDYNELTPLTEFIRSHAVYQNKVEHIYMAGFGDGCNLQLAVVSTLMCLYYKFIAQGMQGGMLYMRIIEEAREIVMRSSNRGTLSFDKIQLGVCVIVAHAFCICKIFQNPNGYKIYANS